MSTLLDTPPAATPEPATLLQDRLPAALKWPRSLAACTLLLGLVFWVQSYQRLQYTDLWGHVEYGKTIWTTQSLPQTEPFMPLAKGMPLVDTQWLTQLVAYLAQLWYGPAALQFLHASSITLCLALLVYRVQQRTGRVGLGVAAVLAWLWVSWADLGVIRPQLAGMACFTALLCLLLVRRWRWELYLAVPALFALWANVHGSFMVGWLLLVCAVAGRATDVLLRTRSPQAVFRDQPLRRLFLLLELAVAATLLNPYGWALYGEIWGISGHANLRDLTEWQPLTIHLPQGFAMATVGLALAIVYRLTPRRVSAIELFTGIAFTWGALSATRMLVWWGPLAVLAVVWHGAAILDARRHAAGRAAPEQTASPRKGLWTVVTLGLAWIFFAYTPFGLHVLQGRTIEEKNILAEGTPHGAAAYLREHPPTGLIFNTYEWGDYLLHAGPSGLKVFVTSHAHLVPTDVWQHYMAIIDVHAGWDDSLDLYGCQVLVLDKANRGALIRRLRDHTRWTKVYEDGTAVIYERAGRRRPAAPQSAPASAAGNPAAAPATTAPATTVPAVTVPAVTAPAVTVPATTEEN